MLGVSIGARLTGKAPSSLTTCGSMQEQDAPVSISALTMTGEGTAILFRRAAFS